MPFSQLTFTWTGWAGAPGISTFRFLDALDGSQADAAAAAVRTFFSACASQIPTGISISCSPEVKVYAPGDGSLSSVFSLGTVPAVTNGTGTGNYASVAGACVVWRTNTSSGRRLVMGRTFLVPLSGGAFSTNGELGNAPYTQINNAAAALIASKGPGIPGHLVIWKRNKPGVAGYIAEVTGSSVNKRGSEHRQRRD